MKNLLLLFLFVNLYCFSQNSMPNLVSLKLNNQLDLVKWTLGQTTYNSVFPNVCQSVVIATSFFDSFEGLYYFKSGQPNNLVRFNTFTNTISYLNEFTDNAMYETQVDLKNGNYYTLKLYNGEFKLYKTNQLFNNTTLIGDYPQNSNSSNFYNRSSTYDSNNNILYFLKTSPTGVVLYKTNVTNNTLNYNIIPVINFPNSGNIFLGYSNENNILYCAFFTVNVLNQTSLFKVGKINTQTGVYEEVMTVNNLKSFINFNVTFDQNSKSFVIMGTDSDLSVIKLYWINPTNLTTNLFNLPDYNLIEIQCDNTNFATTFYSNLSTNAHLKNNVLIYPNPTNETLNIELDENFKYNIYNLLGQNVLNREVLSLDKSIDVRTLTKGIYYIQINSNTIKETIKFVKN